MAIMISVFFFVGAWCWRRFGPDGHLLPPLPEWDPATPNNRVTLVRVLMRRAKQDPVASRFVEQNREALREME